MSHLHFADRLCNAIQAKQTPLIVGIDPRLERLPYPERKNSLSLTDQAMLYTRFGVELIDCCHHLVPAVKPQAAFFEQLGPSGLIALGNVVRHALGKGLLVVMDAKRGDIGSTATAYAQAYLDRSDSAPWQCDALTVNPYLGDDSLQPFVDVATAHGSGLFVLVKTSNPGSRTFQELESDGRSLFEHVGAHVESLAAKETGDCGYGSVGAVIGATHPKELAELRKQMPHTLFLVPGFGAQGGTAADIAGAFDENGMGAIVNSSRAIIFAHERPEFQSCATWQEATVAAIEQSVAEIAKETPAGKLQTEVLGEITD